MTVEGEGMPIPASTARGNLLVKFKVADAKLTKDQIMVRILNGASYFCQISNTSTILDVAKSSATARSYSRLAVLLSS